MIDRETVERIVREVVRRLEAGDAPPPASGTAASAPAATGRRYVVLVTGSPTGLDEAVRQIETIAAAGAIDLVVAACAADAIGPEIARRVRAVRVIREGWGPADPAALVGGAAALVVPLPTTTLAGKAAWLVQDTLAPALVGAALLRNVPVHLASDSLLAGEHAPPAFGLVGRDLVERLGRLGIRVSSLRDLAGAVLEGRGDAATTTGPATVSASAGAICAPHATVACADIEGAVLAELGDDPETLKCAAKVSQALEHAMRAGACRVGCVPTEAAKHAEIASYIDHTLLKPETTPDEIKRLCEEAKRYCFASVCVNTGYVALCRRLLRGSGVKVCCVVGFPLGACTTAAKANETRDAIADGADEIDMVVNIGWLKAGEHAKVKADIEAVVEAAKGRIVKVILETHLLTNDEKVVACRLAKEAGAHFVKTSTGFSGGGATVEDVALMRRTVGPLMGVKASGGVRDIETAKKMLAAGANRLGTSSGIAIVTGKKSEKKSY